MDGFNAEFGAYTLTITSSTVSQYIGSSGRPAMFASSKAVPSGSGCLCFTSATVREPVVQLLLLAADWLRAVQGVKTGAIPPDGYGLGAGWQQLNPQLLTPSMAPTYLVPSMAPSQLPTLQGFLPAGAACCSQALLAHSIEYGSC